MYLIYHDLLNEEVLSTFTIMQLGDKKKKKMHFSIHIIYKHVLF